MVNVSVSPELANLFNQPIHQVVADYERTSLRLVVHLLCCAVRVQRPDCGRTITLKRHRHTPEEAIQKVREVIAASDGT